MATQTLTLLRQRNYSGAHTYGPAHLAAGITAVRLYVVSDTYTDPADGIALDIQESLDDGTTWQDLGGFTSVGTTQQAKNGGPMLPEVTFTFDPPTTRAEAFQGTLTVTGTVNFALMADVTTV